MIAGRRSAGCPACRAPVVFAHAAAGLLTKPSPGVLAGGGIFLTSDARPCFFSCMSSNRPDPTPHEIRKACLAIQADWTENERERRLQRQAQRVEAQVVPAELFYGEADHASGRDASWRLHWSR